MQRILLFAAVGLVIYVVWRTLYAVPPEVRKRRLKYAGIGGVLIGLIAYALITKAFRSAAVAAVVLTLLRALPFLAQRFLGRFQGPGPSPGEAGPSGPTGAAPNPAVREMTEARALEIFELGPDAGREQILERYKHLIKNNHPDRGGSSYLAAQINQARDVLLRKRDSR